jgi:hypothetical protein
MSNDENNQNFSFNFDNMNFNFETLNETGDIELDISVDDDDDDLKIVEQVCINELLWHNTPNNKRSHDENDEFANKRTRIEQSYDAHIEAHIEQINDEINSNRSNDVKDELENKSDEIITTQELNSFVNELNNINIIDEDQHLFNSVLPWIKSIENNFSVSIVDPYAETVRTESTTDISTQEFNRFVNDLENIYFENEDQALINSIMPWIESIENEYLERQLLEKLTVWLNAVEQPLEIIQYGGENLVEIIETKSSLNKKYNCQQLLYKMNFNTSQTFTFQQVNNQIITAFDQLLNIIKNNAKSTNAKIRIFIHPVLDNPISLPFLNKKDINSQLILNMFEKVCQSKKEVKLDANLICDAIIANLPEGAGANEITYQEFQMRGIKIITNAQHCLLRSILVAKAYNIAKDINKSEKEINEAKALIKDSGNCNTPRLDAIVNELLNSHLKSLKKELNEEKLYDFADLKKIEEYLKHEYQITVYNKNGEILYKGDEKDKYLYLLLDNNHFNTIKSMKVFLKKDYFCDKCKIGSFRSARHYCDAVCKTCHRTNCDQSVIIGTCKCLAQYHSELCKRLHNEKVCRYVIYCKKCGFYKNNNHVCENEKWCINCSKAVDRDTHRCYMQVDRDKKNKAKFNGYIIFDYEILAECIIKFRADFINISKIDGVGIDPFRSNITIASACNKFFRRNILKANTIAYIPENGYNTEKLSSYKALSWLAYIRAKEKINIRDSNNGGEVKIGNYFVDGYSKETDTVYEFHGCYYHGHPKCFNQETLNKQSNKTMGSIYERHINRIEKIKKKCKKIIEIWECEWSEFLARNVEAQQILAQNDIVSPINPRDALFGGRTNAIKLYHKCEGEEKIKYSDFTSLYPYIQKSSIYPIGHPKIIREFSNNNIENYFGIIKCKILPPKGLYLPVLPAKINNKLVFTLCSKCALEKQEICDHNDEERTLIGTWISEEIKVAINKGYFIKKIYEVWHFEEKSDDLFKGYVDTFVKAKTEASGYPDWCVNGTLIENEQNKKIYKENFYKHENIELNDIEYNPAKRCSSKICANSQWGYLAMNSDKKQTK